MRKFIDLLNEVSVVDDGRTTGLRVWKNPSKRDLMVLSQDRDLRGMVDGHTVYLWPAEIMTHRMLPQHLGIPYHDDMLPFYVEGDGYVMPHQSAREQWLQDDPEFDFGEAKVFIAHDYFTLDDYLMSNGFKRMVGMRTVRIMENAANILVAKPSSAAMGEFYSDASEALGFLATEYRQGNPRPWNVIKASQLESVWKSEAKLGFIRSERAMDRIADQMYENVVNLYLNTHVSQHTEVDPKDDLDDYFDEDEQEAFVDWMIEYEGGWRISDYGLDPLVLLAAKLKDAKTPEEKHQVCDAMLNVTHQRSDLASWFVEGGSMTLSMLSETD